MIVGALLVRNEADRYLKRVLANANSFCDKLVVLDDGSTDDTAVICREAGAEVIPRYGLPEPFWGNDERPLRSTLWNAACEAADGGWIYIFDADHEMLGPPSDMRALTLATHVNAWSFVLWDCWDSDEQHRTDGYWRAWAYPRPWLVRAPPIKGSEVWQWGDRPIHVGHIPHNYPLVDAVAPPPLGIRHLGYVDAADRKAKAEKYLSLAH